MRGTGKQGKAPEEGYSADQGEVAKGGLPCRISKGITGRDGEGRGWQAYRWRAEGRFCSESGVLGRGLGGGAGGGTALPYEGGRGWEFLRKKHREETDHPRAWEAAGRRVRGISYEGKSGRVVGEVVDSQSVHGKGPGGNAGKVKRGVARTGRVGESGRATNGGLLI